MAGSVRIRQMHHLLKLFKHRIVTTFGQQFGFITRNKSPTVSLCLLCDVINYAHILYSGPTFRRQVDHQISLLDVFYYKTVVISSVLPESPIAKWFTRTMSSSWHGGIRYEEIP